jgi:hypothetical protein
MMFFVNHTVTTKEGTCLKVTFCLLFLKDSEQFPGCPGNCDVWTPKWIKNLAGQMSHFRLMGGGGLNITAAFSLLSI